MKQRIRVLIVAMIAAFALGAAGSAQATVFYTACDGTAATDTVKVKKVEEDGTGAATLADTGIAHCTFSPLPTTFITGLAVHEGYAYFSWQGAADTGIGRVGLNGTGLTLNYIPGPVGAQSLRLNSNIAGGYFYVYADDGVASYPNVANPRVARVPTTGGSFTTVIAPSSPGKLSFGVGGSNLYYATDDTILRQTALDGSGDVIAFASGPNLLVGAGSALVTASASRLFIYASTPRTPGSPRSPRWRRHRAPSARKPRCRSRRRAPAIRCGAGHTSTSTSPPARTTPPSDA